MHTQQRQRVEATRVRCFRPAAILSLLLALVGPALHAAPTPHYDLLIRAATVIDVAAGTRIPGQFIAIAAGHIVATGPDASIGAAHADRNINARGKFIMPGLWDMHVHFGGGPALIAENRALLPLYLAYGITTVRDCAADLAPQVLQWRAQVAAGTLLGPRIFTSGPKLEGPKPVWKGTIEVDSPADVDAALDRLQAMQVDFVKITDNTLKPDIFLYALGAAKARGLRTSAHTPYALTIEQAVTAGLGSIEHIDYLIKAGSPQEAAIAADYVAGRLSYNATEARLTASFDPDFARASYRRLAAQGVSVTPTLNMTRIIAGLASDDHSHDAGLALLGPGLRATYQWRIDRAKKLSPADAAAKRDSYALSLKVLPMLRDAGVAIMAGTDAGYLNSFNYPGIGLHDELALYVQAGLTPADALRSAVLTGPAFLGKAADYGTLTPGKIADILILDADPLADIANTRRIAAVVSQGRLLTRKALDEMLDNARAQAR